MINVSWLQKNPWHWQELLLVLLGALLPFSFAPYDLWWLQFPLFAFLFLSCLHQPAPRVWRRGFLFGLGWFLHGIHWLYYSLHFHGNMPVVVTAITVTLLAMYMSLFPAFALYLANRFFKKHDVLMLLLVYPISWMIFDWLRGYFLTGFPWLQIGTAQIDTPLAGFAPLIGGLGVGLLVTVVAGLLIVSIVKSYRTKSLLALVTLFVCGYLLSFVNWTTPVGEKIKVTMIQGNIPQAEKWKRQNRAPTLNMYREFTQLNWQSDLIIWPETAVPGFRHNFKSYLESLKQQAEKTDTEILLGIFVRDLQTQRYYNSLINLDGQVYQKRHLVPLGEYFPFRPVLGFFAQWVDIPLSDIDSGPDDQPMMTAVGQKIGVSICFEDAFDRDVLKDLPQATLLVNVSNDAWFETSPQPWQHHQIARMRALETGRTLLRVTNTGVSSMIDHKGQVKGIMPQFEQTFLNVEAQAYEGSTPYVFWANYFMIAMGVLLLVFIYRRESLA